MTDDRKTADYADLLSRAENETHRSGMWADTCLLIDELAAAMRSLIGERDALYAVLKAQGFAVDETIKLSVEHATRLGEMARERTLSIIDRAEAAEARLAEYEKALAKVIIHAEAFTESSGFGGSQGEQEVLDDIQQPPSARGSHDRRGPQGEKNYNADRRTKIALPRMGFEMA